MAVIQFRSETRLGMVFIRFTRHHDPRPSRGKLSIRLVFSYCLSSSNFFLISTLSNIGFPTVQEIEARRAVVMVHDYHLYTLPAMVGAARPDVFLHHFIHIPWTQPDAWRVLPASDPRRRSIAGCWPTTSSASTPAPTGATSCSAAAI
jgi:hypothetical protein